MWFYNKYISQKDIPLDEGLINRDEWLDILSVTDPNEREGAIKKLADRLSVTKLSQENKEAFVKGLVATSDPANVELAMATVEEFQKKFPGVKIPDEIAVPTPLRDAWYKYREGRVSAESKMQSAQQQLGLTTEDLASVAAVGDEIEKNRKLIDLVTEKGSKIPASKAEAAYKIYATNLQLKQEVYKLASAKAESAARIAKASGDIAQDNARAGMVADILAKQHLTNDKARAGQVDASGTKLKYMFDDPEGLVAAASDGTLAGDTIVADYFNKIRESAVKLQTMAAEVRTANANATQAEANAKKAEIEAGAMGITLTKHLALVGVGGEGQPTLDQLVDYDVATGQSLVSRKIGQLIGKINPDTHKPYTAKDVETLTGLASNYVKFAVEEKTAAATVMEKNANAQIARNAAAISNAFQPFAEGLGHAMSDGWHRGGVVGAVGHGMGAALSASRNGRVPTGPQNMGRMMDESLRGATPPADYGKMMGAALRGDMGKLKEMTATPDDEATPPSAGKKAATNRKGTAPGAEPPPVH